MGLERLHVAMSIEVGSKAIHNRVSVIIRSAYHVSNGSLQTLFVGRRNSPHLHYSTQLLQKVVAKVLGQMEETTLSIKHVIEFASSILAHLMATIRSLRHTNQVRLRGDARQIVFIVHFAVDKSPLFDFWVEVHVQLGDAVNRYLIIYTLLNVRDVRIENVEVRVLDSIISNSLFGAAFAASTISKSALVRFLFFIIRT